jgi:hypothetical protein
MKRYFSTTLPVFNIPSHPLYGEVDWAKVSAGQYALVVPQNPEVIFYASEAEYIQLLKVYVSKDSRLVVLATPGSSKTITG